MTLLRQGLAKESGVPVTKRVLMFESYDPGLKLSS
jgi:hypothetical protein